MEPGRQEAEALAARANMTAIVNALHDKHSRLLDMMLAALKAGKLCVIDVSQMRGGQALILSSIILRRIFDHNQTQFTEAKPDTIPTLAVVEEAQSVLNERSTGSEPYITWVKEGRKYDLGAVLITQQPGSIPGEILSQGDNWFIFHLLSAGDLNSIKSANAHFSQDILSAILNEPIPGQGVFWSSSSGRPYPIALRVLSFERMHKLQDPSYSSDEEKTYASELKAQFEVQGLDIDTGEVIDEDPYLVYKRLAVRTIRDHNVIQQKLRTDGVSWGHIMHTIEDALPADLDDRTQFAYNLVKPVLDELLGPQGSNWMTVKREDGQSIVTTI